MASASTGTVNYTNPPPTNPAGTYMQLYSNAWSGDLINFAGGNLYSQWGYGSADDHEQYDGFTGAGVEDRTGHWTSVVGPVNADTTIKVRVRVYWVGKGFSSLGTTKQKKSNALAASASAPTYSAVTAATATVACNYFPNVNESVASAQLQYKRTVDSTWINAGTAGTLGGYVQRNVSADLVDLLPSTSYDVRLVITRTTQTGTTLTSSTTSFTTLAGEPTVTTDAATGVTATGAVLNGTLDINEGTGVNVHFVWDTVNPPVANVTADQPMSADGAFQQAISGLSASTPYYFKAVVTFTTPTGSPNEGSVLSFTTPANPLADAAEEDHVQTLYFDRKYGVLLAGATLLKFAVRDIGSSSSDRLLTTAAPFAAGDVKISKDGGAFTNTTNLPAQVTASEPGRTLVLTAAELQCDEAHVVIRDQDGPAFRDLDIIVRTHWVLGSADWDVATGQKANTTAFKATGYGSGHGISGVGGATGSDIDGVLGKHVLRKGLIGTGGANPVLDAGASAVNDFYNSMLLVITSGTGAGQARIVKDYDGGTLTVTPNRAWSTNPGTGAGYVIIPGEDVWNVSPGAELTAIPTFSNTFGQLLQLLFQRFAYKIAQTATTQTFYKSVAGGQGALGSRTVGDDGTTQTIGELS